MKFNILFNNTELFDWLLTKRHVDQWLYNYEHIFSGHHINGYVFITLDNKKLRMVYIILYNKKIKFNK